MPYTSYSCFLVPCEISMICILSMKIWDGAAYLGALFSFWLLLLLLPLPLPLVVLFGSPGGRA